MTLPLLGTAEVVPYAAGNNPSNPGVCVLPDDTVLIAWMDLNTGTITVTHHERDLTVIEQATVTTTADQAAVALMAHGDGALLATATLRWEVATGPLTLTPAGSHGAIGWANGSGATLTTADGTTLLTDDETVIAYNGGAFTTYTLPSIVTSLYPADDGTVYVGVESATVDVYRLDLATGATSLVQNGPPLDQGYPGIGRPDRYLIMPFAPLALYDAAGNVIADSGWPAVSWSINQARYAASIPHPAGGWVSAWVTLSDDLTQATVGVAHDTDDTVTVDDLPHPNLTGLSTPFWAVSPTIAHNGRTAVIALTGYQDASRVGLPADTFGITAWTMEVGQDGLLAVNTLDDGWWIVGTRNPNMAYELLISTPLGWKVEIVAGEEHLATDELCVYDPMHEQAGDDGWVVCALFRPE